jgi:phenylacetate-CoA ligase
MVRREPVAEVMRELEASQQWPRDRLLNLQWERQKSLVAHAFRTVPWYRERWSALGLAPESPLTREDWSRLPVLDKATLQQHGDQLRSSFVEPAFKSSTSGSSGTPTAVLRSQRSWAHHHANVFRGWDWFGLRVGDRYGYVWGLALDSEGRRQAAIKDMLFNRERCSAFSLDAARARAYFERLRAHPVTFLYAYPSAVTQLADEIAAQGLDARALRLKAVVTTAEVLHDEQRERVSGIFGCPVVDSYGCAEVGVCGIACEHGRLHTPLESVVVETMPAENGGTELLLTDLHNRVQPIIRYRIGDLMEPGPADCACGRSLPALGRVLGRAGETLTLPGGRRVNANLPSYIFKHHGKAGTIREYQFVQFPDERVELRLRPGPVWTEGVRHELAGEVRDALGIEVEIRIVERMNRVGRGKHRDYVRAADIGEA